MVGLSETLARNQDKVCDYDHDNSPYVVQQVSRGQANMLFSGLTPHSDIVNCLLSGLMYVSNLFSLHLAETAAQSAFVTARHTSLPWQGSARSTEESRRSEVRDNKQAVI